MPDLRVALYRFYDANDVLLYVGITGDLATRFSQHHLTSPWYATHVRFTVEWCAGRSLAEWLEAQAIATEQPVWNGRPGWSESPDDLGKGSYLTAQGKAAGLALLDECVGRELAKPGGRVFRRHE